MFLFSLACVNAKELNETDDELSLVLNCYLESATNFDDNVSSTPEVLGNKSQNALSSQAYLVLDNDVGKENIYVGEYNTLVVSVLNKGPDTAKNVKVFNQIPKGLKYIKHTTTKGSFNPKIGIWTIGDLSVGDGKVFLKIITQALTAGEIVNNANLTADTYNLNNNKSYEEEEFDVFERHSKRIEMSKKDAPQTMHATANPIALILISFFAIFVASFSKFK